MKKKKGAIEYFISTLIITTVILLIVTGLRVRKLDMINNFVSDGLVSANLASDIINLDKFGATREINISDSNNAYNLFYEALKTNLKLNKKSNNEDLIIDNKVNVDDFIIYNVTNNNVEVITIKPTYSRYVTKLNNLKTPSGVTIKTTSVYSKISFKVKEILGEKKVSKACTTDITTRR
ncbi:hypothetical protein [Clostridium baratii]|uniref:Uncharacterized protein n=1 Tax=Clostridium baratii TaxID=1561 RepID=A0A174V7G6_9CLOT|nr:hypothetical protein [Clostridium baratii]CUQ30704.1 Uncharacterised protein [Clostridium baratii]